MYEEYILESIEGNQISLEIEMYWVEKREESQIPTKKSKVSIGECASQAQRSKELHDNS